MFMGTKTSAFYQRYIDNGILFNKLTHENDFEFYLKNKTMNEFVYELLSLPKKIPRVRLSLSDSIPNKVVMFKLTIIWLCYTNLNGNLFCDFLQTNATGYILLLKYLFIHIEGSFFFQIFFNDKANKRDGKKIIDIVFCTVMSTNMFLLVMKEHINAK